MSAICCTAGCATACVAERPLTGGELELPGTNKYSASVITQMTVTFQQMLTQHILRAQHKQEAQLSPG